MVTRLRVRPGESGLSILEVVVSMSVLVVLLSAFTGMRDREARWLAETLRQTAAERAASARLEVLAAGGGPAGPGRRPFPLGPDAARVLPGATGEEEVGPATDGLLAVTVRVRWKAPDGEERVATLATLVPERRGR